MGLVAALVVRGHYCCVAKGEGCGIILHWRLSSQWHVVVRPGGC